MNDKSERYYRDALVFELANAGAQFHGNSCKCIFHDDKHASAGIYEEDGVWRYKCQAPSCGVGGDIYDIRARLQNTELKNVLPKSGDFIPRTTPQPTNPAYATIDALVAHHATPIVARYQYSETFIVLREDPKSFKPIHHDADGWRYGAPEKPWPLYRRENIGTTEDPVLVVEGEKCVDALWALEIIAVTSSSGAGKGKLSDWTPLAGRDVVLWPDNDADPFTGQKHMEEVGKILSELKPPARVRFVDIASLDLPVKGDCVQFLERLRDKTDDEKRAAVRSVMSPVHELITLIEDAIAGRRKAINLPWSGISELALALLPDTITFLCGAPGSGKSFALLEISYFLHKNGVPVAIYMLEDSVKYHLHRLLAQLAENPHILNPQWCSDNPEESRAAYQKWNDEMELFCPVITAAPNKQPTLKDLAVWTQERAKAGCRVIIIDPISVAKMGREPWNESTEFMVEARSVVRDTGTSLMVSVHPRKGAIQPDLDNVAGGAGFTRLAQTVFWLERHSDFHTASIADPYGSFTRSSNRTMHILKARNARGQGKRIALNFDNVRLRFTELGVITDKKHTKVSTLVTSADAYGDNEDDTPWPN